MSESNLNPNIQAEIVELERRLDEKRRALGVETVEHDKEVFREVFRQRFDELTKSIQAAADVSGQPTKSVPQKDDVKDVEKKKQVEGLLYVAFEKSIATAIKKAETEGGGYLLDELHDQLVDQYYDKLLEFRKIKQL